MSSDTPPATATVDAEPPQWPADVLYLPVAADGKGPDTTALPGTWDTDGTGCTPHADLTGGRWGIVDTARDGWRLLTVDLDVHKMAADRAERVRDAVADGPPTRVHTSQSGGLHVFYWLPTTALTDDGTLPVAFGEHIDDKLNGYVLSPYCEGYAVRDDREPAVLADATALPDVWLAAGRDRDRERSGACGDTTPHANGDPVGVYDVLSRSAYPENERVAHPEHPSTTGTNFIVDAGGETWHCWRHDVTGSGSHLLGMQYGLLDCGEWDGRTIPDATWREIYDTARANGYDIPPPTDASAPDVRAVWDEHADAIEAAEMPTDRLDAAQPVFEAMARAERAGADVELWLDQIAATSYKLPKTTVRTEYEAVRDDVAGDDGDGDDGPLPLDVFLREHIDHVGVHSSPDAHADAEYRWHLTDGREFATTGDTHFRWQELRKQMFNSIRARPASPSDRVRDSRDWPAFIMAFIEEHGEEHETFGPRTEAVGELVEYIRDATAYPSLDALCSGHDRNGVVMPDGPDSTELRVPNHAIVGGTRNAAKAEGHNAVLADRDVTPAALQTELKSRDALLRPASYYSTDDGRRIRCWHLDADALDVRPRRFEPADDD